MSIMLYHQRVYYDEGRGGAVKNGPVLRKLTCKPVIPGLQYEGIDVAPETQTWLVLPKFGGWREMMPAERACVERYLEGIV